MKKILSLIMTAAMLLSLAAPAAPVIAAALDAGTVDTAGTGFDKSFEYTVQSISGVYTEALTANVSGYKTTDWTNEGDETPEYFYYNISAMFYNYTVVYNDGQVFTGSPDEVCERFGAWPSILTEQSYENQLTAGTNELTIDFIGITGIATVEISPSPILRIELDEINIIERSNGYYDTDDTDAEYYRYNYEVYGTAYFRDGTTGEIDESGVVVNERTHWLDVYDNQENEHWTAGGTYSISAEIMGATATADVTIIETPVDRIEFDDFTYVENTNGSFSYDRDGNEYYSYYYSLSGIVYFKNGTQQEYSGSINYNGEYYYAYITETQADEHWTVGNTYNVQIMLLGAETEAHVKIVENPIARVEFEDVSLVTETNGYTMYDSDNNPYYMYSYDAPSGTVYFKNGTSQECSNGIDYEGRFYGIDRIDTQYEEHWTEGHTYDVTAEIMGITSVFHVTIESTPIASIEFEDVSVVANSNGYISTDSSGNEYYNYCYYSLSGNVTFKNGMTQEYRDGVDMYGRWYSASLSDNQRNEHWTPGNTYEVTVTLMGYQTTAHVTIRAIPVTRMEFKDITVVEKTDGRTDTDGNGDEYYLYSYSLTNGTVYFNDGTSATYDYGIEIDGDYYFADCSDNQYTEHWTPGNTYEVTVTLMGVTASFNVTVIETPIARMEFDDITIVEGTSCWTYTDYYGNEYYMYSYSFSNGTIYFKDGTSQAFGGSININGKWYYLNEDDNQSNNHWTAGNTYDVTITLLGVTQTVHVSIVSAPVQSLELDDLTVIEGVDGYIENDGSGEYFKYLYSTPTGTVKMNDGSTKNIIDNAITIDGKRYYIRCADSQEAEHWTVGHTYDVTVTLLGVTGIAHVTVVESPYTGIEILMQKTISENDFRMSGDYAIYDVPEFSFRIISSDGNDIYERYFGYPPLNGFTVTSDQETHPWTVGGNNEFTVSVYGLSVKGCAVIEPASDYEYIEQADGVIITDCRLSDTVINVPDTLDGKAVIGISFLGSDAIYNTEELTIPDSVKYLSDDLFQMYALKTVNIGSGVTYLCADMFRATSNMLESIHISEDNEFYSDIDGVLYNKAGDTIILYPLGHGSEYIVPNTVTNIDALNAECYRELHFTFAPGSTAFTTVDSVTYTSDMKKIVRCDIDKSGAYVMPQSVTEIADCAFMNCDKLTDVTFSSSVTAIVYLSFANCSSLESVSLPENLVSIDSRAFRNCTSLIGVDIPDTLESIGEFAFSECKNLNSVELSSSIKSIGDYAFITCSALTNIELPEGISSIGDGAFRGSGLNRIALPDSLTYMGTGAFEECLYLREATIGSGLCEIPDNTFFRCDIRSIFIPNNIKNISAYAFYYNINLDSVEIEDGGTAIISSSAFLGCKLSSFDFGDNVEYIGESAFSGAGCTSIVIPDSVTKIVYAAFSDASGLTTIDLPDNLQSLGGHVFNGTAWYQAQEDGEIYIENVFCEYKGDAENGTCVEVREGTTLIADYALADDYDRSGITEIRLPDGLKYIGNFAFYGCSSVEKLNIPASVESIGYYAFSHCKSLKSINVDPESEFFTSVDGVLYNKDCTELIWCPLREEKTFTVPLSVERIDNFAFDGSGVMKLTVLNDNTVFEDSGFGYRLYEARYDGTVREQSFTGGVIICGRNSAAWQYADNNLLGTVELTDRPEPVYGDANGDGLVDMSDLTLLRSYLAEYDFDTDTAYVRVTAGADANGDGVIDIKDVVFIRQQLVA